MVSDSSGVKSTNSEDESTRRWQESSNKKRLKERKKQSLRTLIEMAKRSDSIFRSRVHFTLMGIALHAC
jgi:hypothetical protein